MTDGTRDGRHDEATERLPFWRSASPEFDELADLLNRREAEREARRDAVSTDGTEHDGDFECGR